MKIGAFAVHPVNNSYTSQFVGLFTAPKMGFFGKYLSRQGAKNLLHYQYKGADESLLLKYCLSHIHNAILPRIPEWVAPNLITVTGFVQLFAVHLLQARYSPDMTGTTFPSTS